LAAAKKMLGLTKLAGPTPEDDAEFHRLQVACDDPRAKQIEVWAMNEVAQATVPTDDKGDVFIALAKRLSDRIELWATDPDLADAAQKRDIYMQVLRAKIDEMN
jgi:hypothetical protein